MRNAPRRSQPELALARHYHEIEDLSIAERLVRTRPSTLAKAPAPSGTLDARRRRGSDRQRSSPWEPLANPRISRHAAGRSSGDAGTRRCFESRIRLRNPSPRSPSPKGVQPRACRPALKDVAAAWVDDIRRDGELETAVSVESRRERCSAIGDVIVTVGLASQGRSNSRPFAPVENAPPDRGANSAPLRLARIRVTIDQPTTAREYVVLHGGEVQPPSPVRS
jgi:hypothetical protein